MTGTCFMRPLQRISQVVVSRVNRLHSNNTKHVSCTFANDQTFFKRILRENEHMQKSTTGATSTISPSRSRLLWRKAMSTDIAPRVSTNHHVVSASSSSEDESLKRLFHSPRRTSRRSTNHTSTSDDMNTMNQESPSESQAKAERERLVNELKECRAAFQRMKQNANAWKVKYKDLVKSTTHSGDPHDVRITVNINIDGTQTVHKGIPTQSKSAPDRQDNHVKRAMLTLVANAYQVRKEGASVTQP